MTTVPDVELADVIVAMASAVADANAVLDCDPDSSYGITRFEIETNLTAVVRVPTTATWQGPVYERLGRGLYAVNSFTPPAVSGLAFSELLQPTLREAILAATTISSAQVAVRAVIEPMPAIAP